MQLETLQSVLLGEHRNGCRCHSMVDLFILMKTQHCSVSVLVDACLSKWRQAADAHKAKFSSC